MVQQASKIDLSSIKSYQWILVVLALLSVGGGAVSWQLLQSSTTETTQTETASMPQIETVTALGQLEPESEVIQLQASTSTQENRISQLLVERGDRVEAGQAVAILDSRDRLQAAVERAREDVRVAQAKLAQVEAGAKQGEIAAQQAEIARLEAEQQARIEAQRATVARLEAEVENAAADYRRYDSLYQQGAISASEWDSKRLTLEMARRNLQQAEAELTRLQTTRSPELDRAKATLEQIAEVRPVDVEAARTEVERARAVAKEAEVNLEQAYVRSPQDGVVLDIHTRAGEVVSSDGIVEIGQTRQMYAIAEVYQSDIQKVQSGRLASITSDALPRQLQGTVERVGAKVQEQSIVSTDPSANIDARVVEVYIRLDEASSQIAENFTNLQVEVEMEI
jgi:HlyD family secretion protein